MVDVSWLLLFAAWSVATAGNPAAKSERCTWNAIQATMGQCCADIGYSKYVQRDHPRSLWYPLVYWLSYIVDWESPRPSRHNQYHQIAIHYSIIQWNNIDSLTLASGCLHSRHWSERFTCIHCLVSTVPQVECVHVQVTWRMWSPAVATVQYISLPQSIRTISSTQWQDSVSPSSTGTRTYSRMP